MNEKYFITKNVATLTERNALKKLPIQMTVKRYTTNQLGQVLADAAVPVSQRKNFPFHLWGEYDRQSGYGFADMVTQKDNTILLGVYVWGINTPFFFANPVQDVNNNFRKGDIIFLYVDDLTAPNFYHFITISNNQGNLASVVAQSNVSQIDDNGAWGVFRILNFDYTWDNDDQLKLPFYTIKSTFENTFEFQTLNPKRYFPPVYKPEIKTINIDLTMLVNQYAGLSGYLHFNSNTLELLFNLYL